MCATADACATDLAAAAPAGVLAAPAALTAIIRLLISSPLVPCPAL